MPDTKENHPYKELLSIVKEAKLLGASASLLNWDREVFMPEGGLNYRGEQLAQLAGMQHEISTSSRLADVLHACEEDSRLTADPTEPAAVNLREIRHNYDRAVTLPASLVMEEATLASNAQHAWTEARAKSDFKEFCPWLEKIVDLLKRKTQCYGWAENGEPWDALAEDFEPGCTAAQVEAVFVPLRERLRTLLGEIMEGPRKPRDTLNELKLPTDSQMRFVRFVSEKMGFDYHRGRLDVSTHPFCSGTHPGDVRLTTRFHENMLNDALGSTMHESGHGIYEQGLPVEHVHSPMGQAVSLSIHESQSRMWENQVGRSFSFWKWLHPQLADFFGEGVTCLSFEEAYGGANLVKPDFIRVEADEATYNMHIFVRFEIERAILKGDLAVRDIPGVWNEKYKEYLDIDVPDDRRGCLQDVHWSMCAMGYFPTYTLGNLYGAQFFEKALEDIPGLYAQFENGEFGPLKTWLNRNIHSHGSRYRAAELCEHVTGKPLSPEPLMRHLESKFRPLYGI
ncbi:MAG: carboxypeptidase M32 [Opitutales bacterium]